MMKLFRLIRAIWRVWLAWLDVRRDSGLDYREIEAMDFETKQKLDMWKMANRPRAPHDHHNWDQCVAAQERKIRNEIRRRNAAGR